MNDLRPIIDTSIAQKKGSLLCTEYSIWWNVYYFKFILLQNTIAGDYPCNDWRPVIAGMGVMGWELATILQTPSSYSNFFLFQQNTIAGDYPYND